MAKILSAIRATARQMLRDEFVEGKTSKWQDDELDLIIGQVVIEISEVRPRIVKESLSTTASSRELDISDIADLMGIQKLEYRISQDPRDYRNFIWIDDDTLEIDTILNPAADETVYVYCEKPHTLTESASTLRPQMETTLVLGVAAYAAIAKAQEHIGRVNVGGGRTPSDLQGWGLTKMALYQAALRRLSPPKTNTRYPKD